MVQAQKSPAKTRAAGLHSMTGFAAVSGAFEKWTWSVDMRSVNGRGLDLRLRVPDWVDGFEAALRKVMQARLSRGNVTVNVKVTRDEEAAAGRINEGGLAAALEAVKVIEERAMEQGISLAPATTADVAAMRGVLDWSEASADTETAALSKALLESAGACLDAFEAERAREGAAIGAVLNDQLESVEALTKAALTAAGEREAGARAAIDRALARLLSATEVPDEARLTQEMALIAVKNDVTEEIDRLGAHIAAARSLLTSNEAIGRKFDFLMQEFNREANTLCSKAQATDLTAVGLDLKAVIDQMREQVQNVE